MCWALETCDTNRCHVKLLDGDDDGRDDDSDDDGEGDGDDGGGDDGDDGGADGSADGSADGGDVALTTGVRHVVKYASSSLPELNS